MNEILRELAEGRADKAAVKDSELEKTRTDENLSFADRSAMDSASSSSFNWFHTSNHLLKK